MESKPVGCKSVAEYYQVESKLFEQQYKEFLSGYRQWEQLAHANNYVLFKENMGEYLSIDEVAVSQGELYTVLTKKGKAVALVAIIKGTQAEAIISVLKKISTVKRLAVKEIIADLSASMQLMAKRSFPNAILVADRFHVQQLVGEALSDLRIEHRWEALENENQAIKKPKKAEKHTNLNYWKMAILLNNYSHEVDTYSLSITPNGLLLKEPELKSYLNNILILKKLTRLLCN